MNGDEPIHMPDLRPPCGLGNRRTLARNRTRVRPLQAHGFHVGRRSARSAISLTILTYPRRPICTLPFTVLVSMSAPPPPD